MAQEIERLVVRIVGDNSSLLRSMRQTTSGLNRLHADVRKWQEKFDQIQLRRMAANEELGRWKDSFSGKKTAEEKRNIERWTRTIDNLARGEEEAARRLQRAHEKLAAAQSGIRTPAVKATTRQASEQVRQALAAQRGGGAGKPPSPPAVPPAGPPPGGGMVPGPRNTPFNIANATAKLTTKTAEQTEAYRLRLANNTAKLTTKTAEQEEVKRVRASQQAGREMMVGAVQQFRQMQAEQQKAGREMMVGPVAQFRQIQAEREKAGREMMAGPVQQFRQMEREKRQQEKQEYAGIRERERNIVRMNKERERQAARDSAAAKRRIREEEQLRKRAEAERQHRITQGRTTAAFFGGGIGGVMSGRPGGFTGAALGGAFGGGVPGGIVAGVLGGVTGMVIHLTNSVMKLAESFVFGVLQTGVNAFTSLAQSIANVAVQSVKAYAAFEEMQVTFEAFTGGREQSEDFVERVRKLAIETPLTSDAIGRAAKTLMGYGVATENVIPLIQRMGDVAGGNRDRLLGMSLALGQISSLGRLVGQDLRQLTERGFNPLKEIAKTTGESFEQVKERMRQGGISAGEVFKAFRTATSPGGAYHGLMKRIATTTVVGLSSMVTDTLQIAMAEIGRSLVDFFDFKGLLRETQKFIVDVIPFIRHLQHSVGNWGVSWERVRQVLERARDWIKPVLLAFEDLFGEVGKRAVQFGEYVRDTLVNSFSGVWKSMAGDTELNWQNMQSAVIKGVDSIAAIIANFEDLAVPMWDAIWYKMQDRVQRFATDFPGIWWRGVRSIQGVTGGIYDSIQDSILNAIKSTDFLAFAGLGSDKITTSFANKGEDAAKAFMDKFNAALKAYEDRNLVDRDRRGASRSRAYGVGGVLDTTQTVQRTAVRAAQSLGKYKEQVDQIGTPEAQNVFDKILRDVKKITSLAATAKEVAAAAATSPDAITAAHYAGVADLVNEAAQQSMQSIETAGETLGDMFGAGFKEAAGKQIARFDAVAYLSPEALGRIADYLDDISGEPTKKSKSSMNKVTGFRPKDSADVGKSKENAEIVSELKKANGLLKDIKNKSDPTVEDADL